MRRKHRPRARHPLYGRRLLMIGALALQNLSGYELWIRLEDFWAWSKGVRHLSQVRGTSFLEDLLIIFETPEMRQMGLKLLFLLLVFIFSLVCLFRNGHAEDAAVLLILDAAVAASGAALGLYSLHPAGWAQVLKLVPLAVIAVSCLINLGWLIARRRSGTHPTPPTE